MSEGTAAPAAPAATAAPVERQIRLNFDAGSREAATHTNLSAVRADGGCLWVAGDETATIERLRADDPSRPTAYGDQRTFPLTDFVALPGEADEEADLEGLAISGGYLWAVGSHSLRRRRVRPDQADERGIKRLAQVEGQANRSVLIRLPLVQDADGLPVPVREATTDGTSRTAAVLGARGKSLSDRLAGDEHLAPFLAVPGKDNGLDVEGIAVHGDRLYLGLRGPVLRGWAVVLEIAPRQHPDDPARLRLERLDDGSRYRKHFLDLDGLGVRDLCPHGDDLLVLAGPSMDLDGPVRVYRWLAAAQGNSPSVVRGEEIRRELELGYGEGDDHAEGLGLVGPPEDPRLLVVYDSPSPARLSPDGAVLADVVRLPSTS